MSAVELKKLLVKRIQLIDDESLLEEVYSILENRKKSKPLKPMTLKEFRARIAQSKKDIKEGRVYSTQEVLKRLGIKKK